MWTYKQSVECCRGWSPNVRYWGYSGHLWILARNRLSAYDPKRTSGLISVRSALFDMNQMPSGREALSFKHSTNDKACSEGPYAAPQIHHVLAARSSSGRSRRARSRKLPVSALWATPPRRSKLISLARSATACTNSATRKAANIIEYRWADGKYERFPALVAELIAAKVDVIVTAGTPAALAVKKATTTVPLVMVAVGDPVGTGLVPSLARPGGNLTGLSSIAPDLEGKRLDILREVVPTLSHVAILFNSLNPFHVASMRQAHAAAQAMGIKLQQHDIRKSEDLDGAFAAIRKERPDALLILADRVFLHNRQRMMDFTEEQHLPNINAYTELVEAGGLMSYGPSYEDMHKRAAIYVDKIIKGAKPADLPIEQPSKFTFSINLKVAKSARPLCAVVTGHAR